MNLLQEAPITETEQGVPIYESGDVPRCPGCDAPMVPSSLQDGAGTEIRLRCCVRRSFRGIYVAECIDLDLATEADTEEAAIRGLNDAIVGYLMVVFDEVRTDQEIPINSIFRPAPISHRIRYWFEFLKTCLLKVLSRGHLRSRKKFYRAPLGFAGGRCAA